VAIVSSLFAVGAIVGHRSYESHVRARTAPLHGASHIQVWRDLVQIAREARAANLPIPNIPLASLSGFSYVDFKYLEPLLHDELGLPPNEHDAFLDWKECREGRLAEYLAKCPTLLPTAQLLDLDLPNPNPPVADPCGAEASPGRVPPLPNRIDLVADEVVYRLAFANERNFLP